MKSLLKLGLKLRHSTCNMFCACSFYLFSSKRHLRIHFSVVQRTVTVWSSTSQSHGLHIHTVQPPPPALVLFLGWLYCNCWVSFWGVLLAERLVCVLKHISTWWNSFSISWGNVTLLKHQAKSRWHPAHTCIDSTAPPPETFESGPLPAP